MSGSDGHLQACTQLSVEPSAATGEAAGTFKLRVVHVHHDGCIVPPCTCQQSETLRELLETEGAVTLPIPPSQFQAWLDFAAHPTRPAPGFTVADRLSKLVRLIEVCRIDHDGQPKRVLATVLPYQPRIRAMNIGLEGVMRASS